MRLQARIDRADRSDDRLSADWPPVEPPKASFEFELFDRDYRPYLWSPAGPKAAEDADRRFIPPSCVAVSPSGDRAYVLRHRGIEIVDVATMNGRQVDLAPNFVRMSHPKGIAYDRRNHLVSIATSGGDGAFYRYDAAREQWRDFRSLRGAIDPDSLSYDVSRGVYVSATFGSPGIMILSDTGVPITSRRLAQTLPGIGRIGERPVLHFFPHGRFVAILTTDHPFGCGGKDFARVQRIWLYDYDNDVAQLTYKRTFISR